MLETKIPKSGCRGPPHRAALLPHSWGCSGVGGWSYLAAGTISCQLRSGASIFTCGFIDTCWEMLQSNCRTPFPGSGMSKRGIGKPYFSSVAPCLSMEVCKHSLKTSLSVCIRLCKSTYLCLYSLKHCTWVPRWSVRDWLWPASMSLSPLQKLLFLT